MAMTFEVGKEKVKSVSWILFIQWHQDYVHTLICFPELTESLKMILHECLNKELDWAISKATFFYKHKIISALKNSKEQVVELYLIERYFFFSPCEQNNFQSTVSGPVVPYKHENVHNYSRVFPFYSLLKDKGC